MKNKIISGLGNVVSFLSLSRSFRTCFLLFLFPLFFVLHGHNENFGIIPASVTGMLLLKYILITAGIIILNLLWFNSPEKVFFFSFFLIVLFFSFGSFHDTLKNLFPGSRIHSYTVLLPSIIVVSALIYYWLYRRKKSLYRVTRYLSFLLAVLVVLEVIMFVFYTASGKARENNLAGDFKLESERPGDCGAKDYPDIYFIVLDGYTSSRELKNGFQFNNGKADSLFTTANFFISASSKSNYNFTAYSLASTFNMDYIPKDAVAGVTNPKEVMQAVNTLKDNNLVRFLQRKGYAFKNFGRFEMDNMPSEDISFFDYFYYDLIDKQTFYSRVKRDIGWHLAVKNIFTGKPRIPDDFYKQRKGQLERNKKNYRQLTTELGLESDKPKFVYAHLMLPHEPFFLKGDGSFTDEYALINNRMDLKEGYLGQVVYTNRLLEELIPLIAREGKRERVVIIEGDHGYRFYDNRNLHKEFFNLNTYYFSDHDYRMLYDSISPVNSFRVVLNKYFCYDLPLLQDTSFYLKKPGQY